MLCCTSQMFLCLPILWRYWRVPVPLCHCCFRSQSFCGTLKWGYPCVYVRVLPHCLRWLFQFQLYICASSWESQNVACLLAHPCSAIQNNPRTDLRVFTSRMSYVPGVPWNGKGLNDSKWFWQRRWRSLESPQMMILVFGSLVLVYFVESNVFQGGRAGDFPASGLKHHFEERECTVLCFDSSCLVILIFTALINVDLFFFSSCIWASWENYEKLHGTEKKES